MSRKLKPFVTNRRNPDPLLNSILESFGDKSIFMLNSDYNYLGFNLKYSERILKLTGKNVFIGESFFAKTESSNNIKLSKSKFNRALKGSTFTVIETNQGLTKEETHETRFSPILIDNTIIGLIAVITDITIQKGAEKVWETLLKISEEAQVVPNISDLVKFIHHKLSELIFARNFYICLYVEETQKYFFPYFVDEYDKIDTTGVGYVYDKLSGITTYDLSQTITDYVRRTGKPLNYSEKIEKSLRKSGEAILWGTFSPSWLGIPLKLGEKTIGVMALQSYDKPHVYSKNDEDLLIFVSDHIARAIERKNNEERINEQHQLVLQQKNDITDSINYAKYIQTSILPRPDKLNLLLKEYFVLFKPKDIVSGDFYWITNIENKTIVAVVDCTGHGVPGAFMSMLGSAFLNEIINKEYITHPGVILRRLRKAVIQSLQQKGETGEQKDGMDIALCAIDYEKMTLQFAGANNPIYLIRKTKNIKEIEGIKTTEFLDLTLLEFKGDKMPISIHDKMDKFNMHEIKLLKGDCLYLFTDGFADQFGGPDDKKLQYKNLKKIFLEICMNSMFEQKVKLEKALFEWQGNYHQVDDILVMGLKII